MNFQKNTSKQQKGIVSLYVAHFEVKNKFLLIFPPFNWVDQKQLFKQIQIIRWICYFLNLFRKTNFECFAVLFSEIVNLWNKKSSSL